MKPDLKKLIITNLPYLLFVWLFGKMGEAWRLAAGADASQKMLHFMDNAFCKVVIRYAAINAWRDRNRRRQKEISFEYLTEEKFYPLSTSDEFLKSPYEQYPVTICGQTIILTNGELAAALLSLPEKKREIIYLYFFGNYTQQEIADLYGHCKSTAWHYIHSALQMLQKEMEGFSHGEY